MPQTNPKRSERALETTRWPGVFKRGSSFVVRVTIDGRKVQRSAPTAKEAMALRDQLRADRSRGTFAHESPATLAQFSREWLAGYRGRSRTGVRDATVSEYDDDLRLHVLPALGSYRLGAIRPSHVDLLVKQLTDGTAPSQPGFTRRPLSPGSVQRAIAPLRALFADALRQGLVTSSPCAGLRLPGVRLGDRQLTVLEPEQTAALLAAAPEGFDRCLLRLLAETGLRISEALGLTWADLELDVPQLHVRRAVVESVAGEPKSAYGRRTVPLRRELTAELRRFKLASRWSGDDDPVFANARGRPGDYSYLRRHVLAPAVKAAGIPPIAFHALRHTATTDLLRVGVPLKAVSELMGHHSPEFTLSTYSHVLAGDRPDLDALFGAAAR